MIVDCHTQVWDDKTLVHSAEPVCIEHAMPAETRHIEAIDPVDCAIVLGFKSKYLQTEVSNDAVATYVRRHPTKLVGFAGIDPTDESCLDDLQHISEELGLKGVTVSPALQDYHPTDTRAMRLYEACARRGLPILFEQNRRNPAAKLEFAKPVLLDEIAREFPDLRMIIAHMGYPWVAETVVLLGKHQHVYADVSGLLAHPWLCYNALLSAYEYDVMDRLLFGSDFPCLSPAEGIEALYSINQLSTGTNLIAIPREKLRGIVERDALSLLGIEQPGARCSRRPVTILDDED